MPSYFPASAEIGFHEALSPNFVRALCFFCYYYHYYFLRNREFCAILKSTRNVCFKSGQEKVTSVEKVATNVCGMWSGMDG